MLFQIWGCPDPGASACFWLVPRSHRPSGFDAEMRWRRRWFYLPNMVPVLHSLEGRLAGVALALWWLFPLVEEAGEVPTLMGGIEALRA